MNKSSLIKKSLAVVILLLFIGMSVIPSTGTLVEKSTISFDGNTLYVGGDGPGNYTRIQDAVNDALDGDTVFVYNGTYYANIFVRIKVDTSINLIGENRETTIIDGDGIDDVVSVYADGATVSGFTIIGGIKLEASHTNISGNIFNMAWLCIHAYPLSEATHDNIITNNLMFSGGSGIDIGNSHNAIISNNKIDTKGPGQVGIILASSNNCIISGNIIRNGGIFLHGCNNNVIIENRISTDGFGIDGFGIYLDNLTNSCFFNMITRNVIYSNDIGIFLCNVRANIVFENNFLNNSLDVKLVNSQAHFIKNYWNRSRILPKVIFGYVSTGFIRIPWIPRINIDWRPALRPYDIPMGV